MIGVPGSRTVAVTARGETVTMGPPGPVAADGTGGGALAQELSVTERTARTAAAVTGAVRVRTTSVRVDMAGVGSAGTVSDPVVGLVVDPARAMTVRVGSTGVVSVVTVNGPGVVAAAGRVRTATVHAGKAEATAERALRGGRVAMTDTVALTRAAAALRLVTETGVAAPTTAGLGTSGVPGDPTATIGGALMGDRRAGRAGSDRTARDIPAIGTTAAPRGDLAGRIVAPTRSVARRIRPSTRT